MKKITILFLMTLLPMMASADAVEIDGIYYNLVTKAKQAKVTYESLYYNSYSGNFTIPATVTYNDVTYSVTSLDDYAFNGCSGLTSVTIPNSVTSIGNYVFRNCSGLTSVTIPNSVTSIGNESFSGCSSLKSIEFPESVTSIGEKAFKGCSGLTSIFITDLAAWCKFDFSENNSNPLFYAHHLFMDGNEITNLVIPNSVTSIGEKVFNRCYGLTSVTIPNSVTSIGKSAFAGCEGLTSIVIPNSVTSIGGSAFSGCTVLTSVTIPNSVTSIESSAFHDCTGLTSIEIPNSVTSIGGWAFCSCSSVTSVTIPNSVTSIGERAFSSCSGLTTVTIGSGVESIGRAVFNNCEELSKVYCYAENVPTAESDAFAGSYIEYATLHVPEISVTAYKATEPWSGFGTIKAIGDVPVIEKCATPTISFADGKLTFDCDTEGVEYVSSITPPSAFNSGNKTVSVPTTYKVTVYATKSGYEDSDVATKEIEISGGFVGKKGDVNEDGTVNGTDIQEVINIIVNEE